ncbi:hypothetical protein OROMI_022058 [Orobanche minor]
MTFSVETGFVPFGYYAIYVDAEIRPAPHMDNLVGVYKSMEVASGVDIFITQTAVSAKTPGEDNQTGVDMRKARDTGRTQLQALDYADQKQHKRNGSKSASVSTQRSSQSNLAKPSFPAKKRVQVPLYQTSAVQIEHEKREDMIGLTDIKKPKKCPVQQNGTSYTCEKGEPTLSPFFWLRDEDDLEQLSHQTDENQVMYTPLDVPSFSDLKDSDDQVHCGISPERGTCDLSNKADLIDSEMFDWTQRPCSPELCSSPLAMQIEDSAEENGAQEKVEAALTETTKGPRICPKKRKRMAKKMLDKISDHKSGIRMSNKKVSNGAGIWKSKRAKKTMREVPAVHIESDKATNQDVQEGNKDNPLICKGKDRKSKKVFSDASIQEEKFLKVCDMREPLPNSRGITSPHLPALENTEKSSERSMKLKKRGKSSKSTIKRVSQPEKFRGKVKSGKSRTGNAHMITEPQNEVLNFLSHTNLSPLCNDEEILDRGITRNSKEKSSKVLKSPRKVKFSVEGMSKDNCNGRPLSGDDEDLIRCQAPQAIQDLTNQSGLKVPRKMDKAISSVNGGMLLKCNTSTSTICCAFCQLSEESEATGSMVHYLNGKLVADNHNAKIYAIHVHKNCAEWSPNVYFEDDKVINLEIELSRSKRIRCCCCGIKGAALGCYEKSCRKSFHVTCARLTPQCRWDYDNFVMLCPIHATCQLPNEMPRSQSRPNRKSAAERKSSTQQIKTTYKCEIGSTMQWKSQKKIKNLVLCCSALSDTDRGTVAEFENLSGLMILKNWDATVTHVVTSTDENGACRRTLKYLMGVLEGKWILSVEWIKACIAAGELVDEHLYEISIDIHGIRDGPRLGRLRLLNKQPKLFEGYTFFFTGDFVASYKGYLHDLVIASGGKVLNRKPVATDNQAKTFIIYSIELLDQCRPSNGSSILNQRRAQAEALARSSGAIAANNSWILNSIAGYRLQEIGD